MMSNKADEVSSNPIMGGLVALAESMDVPTLPGQQMRRAEADRRALQAEGAINDLTTKRDSNLAQGRVKAAESKAEKAKKYHELWRTWAIEYFMSNPTKDYQDAAKHVLEVAERYGHKMANGKWYKESTIGKKIAGTKDIALLRLAELAKS